MGFFLLSPSTVRQSPTANTEHKNRVGGEQTHEYWNIQNN